MQNWICMYIFGPSVSCSYLSSKHLMIRFKDWPFFKSSKLDIETKLNFDFVCFLNSVKTWFGHVPTSTCPQARLNWQSICKKKPVINKLGKVYCSICLLPIDFRRNISPIFILFLKTQPPSLHHFVHVQCFLHHNVWHVY